MDEMFWIPEDKIEKKRKTVRGGIKELSDGHGEYICSSIERAIETSNAYRKSHNIDAVPLMHIKMRGGAINNTSARNNGLTVEYSYKNGYELVSVTGYFRTIICWKDPESSCCIRVS